MSKDIVVMRLDTQLVRRAVDAIIRYENKKNSQGNKNTLFDDHHKSILVQVLQIWALL